MKSIKVFVLDECSCSFVLRRGSRVAGDEVVTARSRRHCPRAHIATTGSRGVPSSHTRPRGGPLRAHRGLPANGAAREGPRLRRAEVYAEAYVQ
ncbi:unnamed protein product [Leptosia nina]|uniref:Uncharacterized protein n=1 Tax=Leptosia nina TaxID=320188 RepID=A0AAV1ISQ1_9NEOP